MFVGVPHALPSARGGPKRPSDPCNGVMGSCELCVVAGKQTQAPLEKMVLLISELSLQS